MEQQQGQGQGTWWTVWRSVWRDDAWATSRQPGGIGRERQVRSDKDKYNIRDWLGCRVPYCIKIADQIAWWHVVYSSGVEWSV